MEKKNIWCLLCAGNLMGTMLHFHLNIRTTMQEASNFTIDANFTILSGQIMLLTFHICVDN